MKQARYQRGAIAIIVGLALIALVGAVGLALDSGRLFVTKTELQNAADACALAASRELTTTPVDLAGFTRAENAGITVGQKNKRDFQESDVEVLADQSITFSETLDGTYSTKGSASVNSKYVRCTVQRTGIVPWFMQVVGSSAQSVGASAVATLTPSQSNCAIPMGLCGCPSSSAPNFGLVTGTWYQTIFDPGGSTPSSLGSCTPGSPTGNFNWIDFTPPNGGASELATIMSGPGQCNLPPVGPSTCPSGSTQPPGCVGATGAIASLAAAYNSRFGVYQGGSGVTTTDLTTQPPDYTGFAYYPGTGTDEWATAAPQNAYNGSSGSTPNFKSARSSYRKFQGTIPGYSEASSAQLQTYGGDRRLVVVPIVDCPAYTSGQTVPILGYACVLLLNPFSSQPSNNTVRVEYLGSASVVGNPCATSGAPGSSTSIGPLVPALVQ
jgi:Flp pilus assembly protein TadG